MHNKFYRGMVIDLALTTLIILSLVQLFSYLDAFELIVVFLQQHEEYELDELFLALLLASPFMLWLALRRMQDASYHYQQRILQEKRQVQELRFDSLTGLPNNRYFESLLTDEIERSFTGNNAFALAVINIDRFQSLHERFTSRGVRNLTLEIAARIQAAVRACDIVSRIGEDEFSVIFTELEPGQLKSIAHEFSRRVNLITPGEESAIRCSIGLTCFTPRDLKLSASNLLRQATSALYTGRRHSQEKYYLYNKDEECRKLQEQGRRKALSQAIDNGEMVLYLQPQVSMHTGRVSGAEALIRWQHPQQGLLTPDKFIYLLDEHPLSIKLGEWVLATALDKLQALADSELTVSINIAPYHLMHDGFVQQLELQLQQYPAVAPGRLKLEVTESDRILDIKQAARVMQACRRLGVSFSLDDFGTGYSALNQLRLLPASQLKIERGFVRNFLADNNDRQMVHALILLAHRFGLEVVAEGVESAAQLSALSQFGCDIVQGYYYSRPLAPDSFDNWLREFGRNYQQAYRELEKRA